MTTSICRAQAPSAAITETEPSNMASTPTATGAAGTWIFSYAIGFEVDHGPITIYATAPDHPTASQLADERIDAYTATLDTYGDATDHDRTCALYIPAGVPLPVPVADADWQTILHTHHDPSATVCTDTP